MTRLSLSLCVVLVAAPAFAQKEQQDPAAIRKKVDAFLKENPAVVRDIEAQNIARENLEWMFRVGEAKRGEDKNETRRDDAARAERAIKAALKVMTEAGTLKDKQAAELYAIVFPRAAWDAEQFNPCSRNPNFSEASTRLRCRCLGQVERTSEVGSKTVSRVKRPVR